MDGKEQRCQDERYVAVPWMAKSNDVRMNGQLLCSRQKLSTTIHGGTAFMFRAKAKHHHPWRQCCGAMQFLGIHASTALVHPCTSMAKSNDVHDYKDVGGSAKQDARAEDERSAFMFRTKAKYHHRWQRATT